MLKIVSETDVKVFHYILFAIHDEYPMPDMEEFFP
jgi:hypothetical protein